MITTTATRTPEATTVAVAVADARRDRTCTREEG